jgi:hypothetical protein
MVHKRLVFAVGAALLGAGLVWGALGFYVGQAVWVVGLLAVGGAIIWIATKMPRTDASPALPPARRAGPRTEPGPRRPIRDRIAETQFTTTTSKSFAEIVELGRAAATAAAGVATTVHEAKVVPGQDVFYTVRRLGVRTVLSFGVHVSRNGSSGATVVGLRVGDFLTTQAKVLGIGIGRVDAPGYGPLARFSHSLQQLLDEDAPAAEPADVPAPASSPAPAPAPVDPSVPAVAPVAASATGSGDVAIWAVTVPLGPFGAIPAARAAAMDRAQGGDGRRPWLIFSAALGAWAVLCAGVVTAVVLVDDGDPGDASAGAGWDAPAPQPGTGAGGRLHPVLQLDPTVVDGCDSRTEPAEPDAVLVPSADGTICFTLGPTIVELDDRSTYTRVTDGWPAVEVLLDDEAARAVAEHTAAHFAESMAVAVDGVVVGSLPIHGEITGGRLFIEVGDEEHEARLLQQLQGG